MARVPNEQIRMAVILHPYNPVDSDMDFIPLLMTISIPVNIPCPFIAIHLLIIGQSSAIATPFGLLASLEDEGQNTACQSRGATISLA